VADFPATIHRTEISAEARRHYHKRLTEAYYVLDCEAGALLELDGERVPARPGLCVLIRPGTWHRAVGKMTVLIVVVPKFDPADEWFDDEPVGEPGGSGVGARGGAGAVGRS
jgi:mannose-6-phosphate isomerase-like protein (cupin superfamily)